MRPKTTASRPNRMIAVTLLAPLEVVLNVNNELQIDPDHPRHPKTSDTDVSHCTALIELGYVGMA